MYSFNSGIFSKWCYNFILDKISSWTKSVLMSKYKNSSLSPNRPQAAFAHSLASD